MESSCCKCNTANCMYPLCLETDMKILVRGAFAYDSDKVSQDTGLECLDESLTDQSQKEDCDINTLVKRFGITGQIPVLDVVPSSGDFTGVSDYHSALNALIAADQQFMELPAEIRSRFDHNPGKFVDFCSDEKNRDELIKMGLVKKPSEPRPVLVEIAQAIAPAAPAAP